MLRFFAIVKKALEIQEHKILTSLYKGSMYNTYIFDFWFDVFGVYFGWLSAPKNQPDDSASPTWTTNMYVHMQKGTTHDDKIKKNWDEQILCVYTIPYNTWSRAFQLCHTLGQHFGQYKLEWRNTAGNVCVSNKGRNFVICSSSKKIKVFLQKFPFSICAHWTLNDTIALQQTRQKKDNLKFGNSKCK